MKNQNYLTEEKFIKESKKIVTKKEFNEKIAMLVTRKEFEEKIALLITRKEFDSKVALLATKEELRAQVEKLAIAILRVDERVNKIEENMATKADIRIILDRFDDHAKKMDSLDKFAIIHEYRIKQLEIQTGLSA
ncbi:MAG: hypothetical protein ACKVQC_07735 [Elusimicrobiota bacterium]